MVRSSPARSGRKKKLLCFSPSNTTTVFSITLSNFQVLFLMYHYFNAKEIYNAIRVFIAAYVWMTGFGNFSYYYVRKDFSLGRFAQVHLYTPLVLDSLYWSFPNMVTPLTDDVAPQFLCYIVLHCPEQ